MANFLLMTLINNGSTNFSNLSFKDENVFNVELSEVKYLFENCSFEDVNMGNCRMSNCNFKKSKFEDVNMSNCVFTNCDFTGSSFTDVNLNNCFFNNCTGLDKSTYRDINLMNTKGIPLELINDDDDYNMSGNYSIGMMSGGFITQSNVYGVNISSMSGNNNQIISGNNIRITETNGKSTMTIAGVKINVDFTKTKVLITIGGKQFEIDKTIKQKEPIQYLDITAQIFGRTLFIVAESGGSIQMTVK